MTELLFITSLLTIVYIYAGYPLIVGLLGKILNKKLHLTAGYEPTVTLIIAAYNEEKSIAQKLDNCLTLDYPKDKLEIIVTSDHSDDDTDNIVKSYADQGIKLHRLDKRMGKTGGQNETAQIASGEILLFTDATTTYDPDMIRKIVSNFSDDSIGCVGAELTYREKGHSGIGSGNGLYWKYETYIRHQEQRINSVIGVSGCLYGVRKSLYEPIRPDVISDFIIASVIRKQGFRTIIDPQSKCYEDTTETSKSEFTMRVRVAIRSLWGMWCYRSLLNPLKYGVFAWQMLSHKLLRYLAPIFLIILLLTNIILAMSSFTYLVLLLGQFLFYALAFAAHKQILSGYLAKISFIPYYFTLLNMASLMGLVGLMQGKREVTWTPLRN